MASCSDANAQDFIKCFRPTYMGDFSKYKGKDLRLKGINRYDAAIDGP